MWEDGELGLHRWRSRAKVVQRSLIGAIVVEEDGAGMPDDSPRTLEQTLLALDEIIDRTRAERSELGIFPSMYRSVTAEIRDAIGSDFFDDGTAMEALAVKFADRYLIAFQRWSRGRTTRDSWRIAFEAATDGRRRMVAQHLLAGMNAHINLDLGIVAADVAGDQPERFYEDFLRVNEILFQKLDGLQGCLGSVSNRMTWMDRLGGSLDERLMKMVIKEARDGAWDLALDLIANPAESESIIEARDRHTADLGLTILGGALPIRVVSQFVARSEPRNVRSVLDAFSERTVDFDGIEEVIRGDVDRRGQQA